MYFLTLRTLAASALLASSVRAAHMWMPPSPNDPLPKDVNGLPRFEPPTNPIGWACRHIKPHDWKSFYFRVDVANVKTRGLRMVSLDGKVQFLIADSIWEAGTLPVTITENECPRNRYWKMLMYNKKTAVEIELWFSTRDDRELWKSQFIRQLNLCRGKLEGLAQISEQKIRDKFETEDSKNLRLSLEEQIEKLKGELELVSDEPKVVEQNLYHAFKQANPIESTYENHLFISLERVVELIKEAFPFAPRLLTPKERHGIHVMRDVRTISEKEVLEIYAKRMLPRTLIWQTSEKDKSKGHFCCRDFANVFMGICREEQILAKGSPDQFAIGEVMTWGFDKTDKVIFNNGFTYCHMINLIITHDDLGNVQVRLFEPQSGKFLSREEIAQEKFYEGLMFVCL